MNASHVWHVSTYYAVRHGLWLELQLGVLLAPCRTYSTEGQLQLLTASKGRLTVQVDPPRLTGRRVSSSASACAPPVSTTNPGSAEETCGLCKVHGVCTSGLG